MTRRIPALYELPPAGCKRWTAARKALVVVAVENGILTMAEARSRYALSEEEFMAWRADYKAQGLEALKITKLQQVRMRR